MAGVINNKNAEKWTQEKTLELVQQAYDTVTDDCYFLSDVADKCGVYRQLFDYLMDKFNDDQMVFDTLKRLYNKCEAIVTKNTANGKIVPSLGIFILKAYHGLFETSKLNADVTGDMALTGVSGFKVIIENDSHDKDAPEAG